MATPLFHTKGAHMHDEHQQHFDWSKHLLRLRFEDGRIVVDAVGTDPRPLIPVPASRIDWLTEAASRMWRRQQRCLAALLLTDPSSGGWTIRIPRQRCGSDSVSWSVAADDFAGLGPEWVLGGTFQVASASAYHLDRLTELVPAADGLHFVLVYQPTCAQLRAFIRGRGELRPADEHPVMLNDWGAVLDAAMPRLTLS